MKAHICSLTLLAALTAGTVSAGAQSRYSREVKLPGVTGLIAHDSLPEGFDPVGASAEELDEYGLPPRPDVNDEKKYALWLDAMHMTRVTGEYTNTGRYHRPAKNKVDLGTTDKDGISKIAYGNWSGFAISGGSPKFVEVEGRWTIPTIASQHESFTGYMSEWVGIDGDNNGDLIQDGIEEDWTGGAPHYYAWVEFIPNPEVKVSLTVAPGDTILAETWESTKNGVVYGNYFLGNYNTGKSISTSLKIPAGQKYLGATAEWIVERTEYNGSFNNPLPDYAFAYMDSAYATRSTGSAIPGVSKANQNITMEQGSTKLSEVQSLGADAMLFNWVTYY